MLSWWELPDGATDMMQGWVADTVLDIDGAGGKSEDGAEAIHKSLDKVHPSMSRLDGGTTDSGGSSVLESLGSELEKRGLCSADYAVNNCCLHAQQLGFANAVLAAFGAGGIENRTMLQRVHCCYDLQNWNTSQKFVICGFRPKVEIL